MMNAEQITRAIEQAREEIVKVTPMSAGAELSDKGKREFIWNDSTINADRHLVFMLETIPAFLRDGRREKAMRWLGFVQGAIWVRGYVSIEDLKRANAPEGSENREHLR